MGGGNPLIPALSSNTTVEELSNLLGTTYKKIRYFYYVKKVSDYYREFSIPKKSGGERKIFSPDNQLGLLQSRLSHLLSDLYHPRDAAKAFIKGRSIVQNAQPHLRKEYVFNIDLLDFFPSITFARVRGLLMAEPYRLSPEVSTVIAHLCTLNGRIPQGAPSSPVISNMICSRLDRELILLAKDNKCVYTRYADDITFSFLCPLRYLPEEVVAIDKQSENHFDAQLGTRLNEIIEANGFKVNPRKTRLQSKRERQVVTGIKVNKKLNLDRRFIRKTSAILHSFEVNGIQAAEERYSLKTGMRTGLLAHLRGRICYIGQIKGLDSTVYVRLALRFNNIFDSVRLPLNARGGSDRHFSKFANARCWIVEAGLSQATAFMLQGGYLVTCNHFFTKRPEDFEQEGCCELFRVNDRTKLKAIRVYADDRRDLALLKMLSTQDQYEYFNVGAEEGEPMQGSAVSILGFPDFKSGASAVNRIWAHVTNTFPLSGVKWAQVDHDIDAGNSGGPVINDVNEVVGVAARGKSIDKNEGEIVGWNGFVSLSELRAFLVEALARNEASE